MAAIKKNVCTKHRCQWCSLPVEENKLRKAVMVKSVEEGTVDIWVCKDEDGCVERTLEYEDKLRASKKED